MKSYLKENNITFYNFTPFRVLLMAEAERINVVKSMDEYKRLEENHNKSMDKHNTKVKASYGLFSGEAEHG